MNQLPKKSTGFFKNLLIIIISTCVFFILLSLVTTFFLKKIPRFENFYWVVPWVITLLSALFLSFFARLIEKESVLLTLISSLVICLLFLVIGFVLGIDLQSFSIVLARYVFFVIGAVLLSFFQNSKKHKKRSSGKKFKFSK